MEGLEQIAIAGGKVTVSMGAVVAAGAWLLKQWGAKQAEAAELKRRNLELEREVNEAKSKLVDDSITRLNAAVSNHTKLFHKIVEEVRKLQDKMTLSDTKIERLDAVLERVLRVRTETQALGKNATIYKTKKPSDGSSNG